MDILRICIDEDEIKWYYLYMVNHRQVKFFLLGYHLLYVNEKEKSMIDIVVIGGGPAGLNAGLYAKRSGLSVVIVEKIPYGVGQTSLSSEVDNYLGFWGLSGYDLGEHFKKHVKEQGVEIREGEVTRIEKDGEFWKIFINQDFITARAVIYAAGAVYRPLPVKASAEDLKKSVSYCAVCDGAFHKGKEVAIIGGGDTALGDALYLSQICSKVYLIHRRDKFRGSDSMLKRIMARENVEILTPYVPNELKREEKEVVLILKNMKEDKGQEDSEKEVRISHVFAAIGMTPGTGLVSSFIELDNQGYIIADESGKTNVEGFFAAGDVRTKALRQIITAVSDGAYAAVSAQEYLEMK